MTEFCCANPTSASHDEDARSSSSSSSSTTSSSSSSSSSHGIYTKPIIVGYVFGPKKMSTMGVVMAEASKAHPFTHFHADHQRRLPLASHEHHNHHHHHHGHKHARSTSPISKQRLTRAILSKYSNGTMHSPTSSPVSSTSLYRPAAAPAVTVATNTTIPDDDYSSTNNNKKKNKHCHRSRSEDALVVFQMEGQHQVARYFRSSCSSNYEGSTASSTGTCTASTATTTTTPLTAVYASSGSSITNKALNTTTPTKSTAMATENSSQQRGITTASTSTVTTVSFVPLDPDIPIHEQHNGGVDIVLHKLTEDILCMAQLSSVCSTDTDTNNNIDNISTTANTTTTNANSVPSAEQQAALRRINHVLEYTGLVVDPPRHVQQVMSRATIAKVLAHHLNDNLTLANRPVAAPAYAVYTGQDNGKSSRAASIMDLITTQGLQFPLILKPLTAAGTKASHAMAVVLTAAGFEQQEQKQTQPEPCLIQEYSNHDAVLYKIYVLGSHVSVHARRSLPNLPPPPVLSTKSIVYFDSQRPYPKLQEFGYPEMTHKTTTASTTINTSTLPRASSSSTTKTTVVSLEGRTLNEQHDDSTQEQQQFPSSMTTSSSPLPPPVLTESDVQPLVTILKQAFHLELFGFDVIYSIDKQAWLVIDVNYFPSYKEVSDFPTILSQYLIRRVLEHREVQEEEGNEEEEDDDDDRIVQEQTGEEEFKKLEQEQQVKEKSKEQQHGEIESSDECGGVHCLGTIIR